VTFDSKLQRQIMGMFATGVTVIGMKDGDSTWGMTANAVTSVSLDPPLVLVCVDKSTQTHPKLTEAKSFSVNILTAAQEEISNRFAFKGPKDFSGLDTKTAETGAPILLDTLGWVDCKLAEVLPGGDHDIFVGEIIAGELGDTDASPLTYYQGKYGL